MHTNRTELKIDPGNPEIQYWHKIRQFWNEWDPIGVACEDIQDEYDTYITPTLEMLGNGCSKAELDAYLSHLVRDYIGLGDQGVRASDPAAFAQKLMEWYRDRNKC